MATSITWTDGEGAATLTNGVPAPGDRFRGWTNRRRPIGATAYGLGTGQRFMFTFRRERIASFSLEQIPMASLDLVSRLIEHLEEGGTVTVNTGDNASRSYPTCGLAEGTEISLQQQSATDLTYTLGLTVVNLANDDDLTCDYDE